MVTCTLGTAVTATPKISEPGLTTILRIHPPEELRRRRCPTLTRTRSPHGFPLSAEHHVSRPLPYNQWNLPPPSPQTHPNTFEANPHYSLPCVAPWRLCLTGCLFTAARRRCWPHDAGHVARPILGFSPLPNCHDVHSGVPNNQAENHGARWQLRACMGLTKKAYHDVPLGPHAARCHTGHCSKPHRPNDVRAYVTTLDSA